MSGAVEMAMVRAQAAPTRILRGSTAVKVPDRIDSTADL